MTALHVALRVWATLLFAVMLVGSIVGMPPEVTLLLGTTATALLGYSLHSPAPPPAPVLDGRQRRLAALTAQAEADRDRCLWILERNRLEQDAGVTPFDYSDEVAEISARTTALEAELAELAVIKGPAPLPPPSQRPDPVGPVPAVEDIDRVFGYAVDHATSPPCIRVPTFNVARMRRLVEARGIGVAVRCDDLAEPERWTMPTEVEPVTVYDAGTGATFAIGVRPLGDVVCTCGQHRGRGIPDCPVHVFR